MRSNGSRVQTLLGRVEIDEFDFDAALAAFDAAEGLLGDCLADRDDAVVDQWLELTLHGRVNIHLLRNEPELAMAALFGARPLVEARGSPDRRQVFYRPRSWQRAQQNRYCIDEQVLIDARTAAAIATETGDVVEIAWRACQLGMWLTMRCELGEAQKQLEGSLAVAERSGNVLLQAACLAWLAQGALRRHDTRAVRSLAPQASAACEARRSGRVGGPG